MIRGNVLVTALLLICACTSADLENAGQTSNSLLTVLTYDCEAQQAVSQTECLALIDLYNATDGANWTDNANWGTSTPDNWYGITVSNGSVVSISLWNNNLVGNLPSSLGDLASLQVLWLEDNVISGSLPTTISGLKSLEDFTIQRNQLTGNIPAAIGGLSSIKVLGLEQNDFTGSIPTEIGLLTSLTNLRLNSNSLTGTIPSELGSLTGLTNLGLGLNTNLGGDLPSTLAKLSQLKSFSVRANNHTGNLPDFSGSWPHLETIILDNNNFTGTIATGYFSNASLTAFDIAYNQVTGTIPSNVGTPPLTVLGLSNNQLSGTVPSGIMSENYFWFYIRGNDCFNDGGDGTLRTWLNSADPQWQDGCITDADGDGVAYGTDSNDDNPYVCQDTDSDGCDDCANGSNNPTNDGPDADADGICNAGDNDDDNDTVADALDTNPTNPDVCQDVDADGCDDCSLTAGPPSPTSDGPDTDGDGLCNAGDNDDDNDTVPDASDFAPLDPFSCSDADLDACDDCSITGGPPSQSNDGTDSDQDGICDASDFDSDGDGVVDTEDINSDNPTICGDSDADTCDDCGVASQKAPHNDGSDYDADGLCDAGDDDDDNDGATDDIDLAPQNAFLCGDTDGDGCEDCSSGTFAPSNDGPDEDGDGLCGSFDPIVPPDNNPPPEESGYACSTANGSGVLCLLLLVALAFPGRRQQRG